MTDLGAGMSNSPNLGVQISGNLVFRARGHTQEFLLDLFDSICWIDRDKFLESKEKVALHDNLIVLSSPLFPGFNAIRRVDDLRFTPFRNSAATGAIFPNYGTWVVKSAPKLGAMLY
jgi:hypothetical protein